MGLGRVESPCCRVSVRHNWSATRREGEAFALFRGDGVEGDTISGETLLGLSLFLGLGGVRDMAWLAERGTFGYLRFEIGELFSSGEPSSLSSSFGGVGSSSESTVSKDVKDATESRDISGWDRCDRREPLLDAFATRFFAKLVAVGTFPANEAA